MNQQKASIASNGRTIPIVVSRKHDLQEQQQLQKQQQQQHDQNRLFSRRRSISLVEIDDIKEDPDATPVPRRKAQPQPRMANSRPSSYFFTEGLDKMADDIINSVRSPNSASNVMDEPPLTTALKNQATGLVRRTSSGYSTGSAGSVRVLKPKTNSNEKSSGSSTRKSIIGLVKRTSTSVSGGHTTSSSATSTSPVQSRIASKSTSTSKKISSSSSSGSGSAQQQQLQTSNDKRAQFTQVRSKTGLNIFGGRRRSIAITDDAYNAAMRAAKSHLDLRDAMEQQPPAPASPQAASTNSAIERKKSSKSNKSVETASPGTKSSDVESPPAKKQIFGERPWIELEKLWRGRLKNPPPDLTEDDFLSLTSSSSAASKNHKSKASTLPVNSRPPTSKKDSKKQPIPEKWPPQNLQVPRRTASNAGKGDEAGATGISREVAKKAITLLSEGEVLEDFRQSKSDGCLNKRPHSFALTSVMDGDNHFDELVKIW